MTATIILIFIIGYTLITLEHPFRLNKTVPALLMAALMWALLSIGFNEGTLQVVDGMQHIHSIGGGLAGSAAQSELNEEFRATLLHHLGKTAEILMFLIGAMTIVEIVDLHRGFDILKSWVKTCSKRKLLWILCLLAWLLSAIIDNLTTTIVLVTLIRKLIPQGKDRWWYASMVVIAANAGGAWSPIGDVTTTMLWIAHRVSALGLIDRVVLPALICMVFPTAIASFLPVFRGEIKGDRSPEEEESKFLLSSKTMLCLGLSAIAFVPVFKAITHLPPYMGMMLSLGAVWLVSEYVKPEVDFTHDRRHLYSVHKALARIEMSSILFFLGILMAVSALEAMVLHKVGTLQYLAQVLDQNIPNRDIVILLLGGLSAVIDNVPLVAASIGMYTAPIDNHIWQFIAYSAGTGGSLLIVGSAAGVAAMGMERIDFLWYLRKISWLALMGFLAGAGVYLVLTYCFHFDTGHLVAHGMGRAQLDKR